MVTKVPQKSGHPIFKSFYELLEAEQNNEFTLFETFEECEEFNSQLDLKLV